MVLSDSDIMARLGLPDADRRRLRIEPFVGTCPEGLISYGLTSGGYDVRLADRFRVFTDMRGARVDPKSMDPACFDEVVGRVCWIPPNSFALGYSVETFRIPRDVIATCLGKSTYARCGVLACCTPLEPEWEGQITVEVSNTTPCPACVYAGEGIMQVLFHQLSSPCDRSYADKRGKYQNQKGITLPRV
jgi:dCTP deaminase